MARNYKGEYATAGSIFVDYRNASDFSDIFTILYGHRMGGGRMFSDVTLFADETYFKTHEQGSLLTPEKNYRLEIVAFAKIRADDMIVYDVGLSKSGRAIEYLYDMAIRKRDSGTEGVFILLSTCDVKEKNLRDVLLLRVLGVDVV